MAHEADVIRDRYTGIDSISPERYLLHTKEVFRDLLEPMWDLPRRWNCQKDGYEMGRKISYTNKDTAQGAAINKIKK